MLRHAIIFIGASLALAGCSPAWAPRQAEHLGRGHDEIAGEVTAESRYGAATITAPVRQISDQHFQVRLPGGTWVDCHLSCRETLRRETVDFWPNHSGRNDGGTDGPGYFFWRR